MYIVAQHNNPHRGIYVKVGESELYYFVTPLDGDPVMFALPKTQWKEEGV